MRSFMSLAVGALFFALLGLSGGCASIVDPGPDKVTFNSEPDGAMVSIDGKNIGATPVVASIERRAQYVTFTKDGYEDTKVGVARHLNGWVFGNIIFGGIIGLAVDCANNNVNEADPTMKVTLHRSASSAADYLSTRLAWARERVPSWLNPANQKPNPPTP
jgi:PEGA domain